MTVLDLKRKISSLPDDAIIIDGISEEEVIIEFDKEVGNKLLVGHIGYQTIVKIACGYEYEDL